MTQFQTISDALRIAVKYHNDGKILEAKEIYNNILEQDPNNSDALHLLGLINYQQNDYDQAIKYIKNAIELKSTAIYHGNLAMTYNAKGDKKEAEKHFSNALKLNPNYDNANLAYYNLGVYAMDNGEYEKALDLFSKSLKLIDLNEAHWNRSITHLTLGKFKEGWEEYDYRFKISNPIDSRIFKKQKWDGSNLQNKKILIVSEQGFGDDIQFIRYIPLVKEKGAHIILECKKDLMKLFQGISGIDQFIEKEEKAPEIDYDCYIHLMSLPKLFPNLIPNKTPYLISERNNTISSSKFKIGIVWAGNPENKTDKSRSTTQEKFDVFKEIPEIELYSLQKDIKIKDPDISDLSEKIKDFSDTASLIESLDLIITIDTSVAHLAGALNKPVWVLLSSNPGWRYLLNRNDSPWYPSMRLFRQKNLGDWDALFQEVKRALQILISSKSLY
jgi:tetratricopeptide (TPR) repeat protein